MRWTIAKQKQKFSFHQVPLKWKNPTGREEERGAPVEVNLWPLFRGATGPRLHFDLQGLTSRWSMTCLFRRGQISPSHFSHSGHSRNHCRRISHRKINIHAEIKMKQLAMWPQSANEDFILYFITFMRKVKVHLLSILLLNIWILPISEFV